MAFTVKIITSPFSPKNDGTAGDAHETSIKDYLDAQSITTLHAVSTIVSRGVYITTIVFE